MAKDYPAYIAENKLAARQIAAEIPDVLKGFSAMTAASHTDGVLDKKTKELIALAIGVSIRCDGCIGYHTQTLVNLGATRQEISEMLGVVIQMNGGPGVVYAADALTAYDQFVAAKG
jgi:AhpD family alkylhydroperoxidase